MRVIIKSKKTNTIKAFALGILFSSLASFTVKPGGEGFQIYINNKLAVEKFGNQLNTVSTIQLSPGINSGQLTVKYYHCGRTGKNRSITIRDGQNRVLKEWRYADASTANFSSSDPSMSCEVSDILSLQKKNHGKLNLYYSSSELPGGRLLAIIIPGEFASMR